MVFSGSDIVPEPTDPGSVHPSGLLFSKFLHLPYQKILLLFSHSHLPCAAILLEWEGSVTRRNLRRFKRRVNFGNGHL